MTFEEQKLTEAEVQLQEAKERRVKALKIAAESVVLRQRNSISAAIRDSLLK
jgi:hypothetical protein